jgi:hypothetical protein
MPAFLNTFPTQSQLNSFIRGACAVATVMVFTFIISIVMGVLL